MDPTKDISLALGGGGARGNAHLGVLRVLDRAGYAVKAIAGTSAGAAYGALYAAGYPPDEIITRLTQVDQGRLFGRSAQDGPSLLGFSGLSSVLYDFLGDRTFDQLNIPMGFVAVDLRSGREVLLRSGRVIDALLASMAMPGVFPPREWNDTLLVDGGVLDNVPVIPARYLRPDLPVVAVVISDPCEEGIRVESPLGRLEQNPFLQPLVRLRVAQSFNIFVQAYLISSNAQTSLRLKIDRPEVIIWPDVSHVGVLDPADIVDLAERGEKAAQEALPAILEATSLVHRLQLRLRNRKIRNTSLLLPAEPGETAGRD